MAGLRGATSPAVMVCEHWVLSRFAMSGVLSVSTVMSGFSALQRHHQRQRTARKGGHGEGERTKRCREGERPSRDSSIQGGSPFQRLQPSERVVP